MFQVLPFKVFTQRLNVSGGALFASALLYRLSELAEGEEEAELSRDMALHSESVPFVATTPLCCSLNLFSFPCRKREKERELNEGK